MKYNNPDESIEGEGMIVNLESIDGGSDAGYMAGSNT